MLKTQGSQRIFLYWEDITEHLGVFPDGPVGNAVFVGIVLFAASPYYKQPVANWGQDEVLLGRFPSSEFDFAEHVVARGVDSHVSLPAVKNVVRKHHVLFLFFYSLLFFFWFFFEEA